MRRRRNKVVGRKTRVYRSGRTKVIAKTLYVQKKKRRFGKRRKSGLFGSLRAATGF